MRAKQFFYVCAGILMIMVAYSVVSEKAQSQTSPEQVVGITSNIHNDNFTYVYVLTASGNIYSGKVGTNPQEVREWRLIKNVFDGTVAVQPATMTDVKEKFREKD